MRRLTAFHRTVNDVRYCLASVGLDTKAIPVRSGKADDCWGFWTPSLGIIINPDLKGIALYRVLFHEFGHALGLDHSRSGLMSPYPIRGFEKKTELPTASQKKRWVMQVARRVLEKRGKQWRAA